MTGIMNNEILANTTRNLFSALSSPYNHGNPKIALPGMADMRDYSLGAYYAGLSDKIFESAKGEEMNAEEESLMETCRIAGGICVELRGYYKKFSDSRTNYNKSDRDLYFIASAWVNEEMREVFYNTEGEIMHYPYHKISSVQETMERCASLKNKLQNFKAADITDTIDLAVIHLNNMHDALSDIQGDLVEAQQLNEAWDQIELKGREQYEKLTRGYE